VADCRLADLSLPPRFGATNPFPFMALQDVAELSNFFERTVSAYQVGVAGTVGLQGCTRGFVIPSMKLETALPETGDTVVDLGLLTAGRLDFVCSVGMVRGVIEAI
jgi:hypothetical protein